MNGKNWLPTGEPGMFRSETRLEEIDTVENPVAERLLDID
jgi:hypothetical protein